MIELVAIVSSFNRAALLKDALSSLVRALRDVPEPSAIVVLDAGSRDGSQSVVEKAKRSSPVEISLLENAGVSFAAGVNRAITKATELYPSAQYFLLFETDNFLDSGKPIAQALDFLRRRRGFAAVGFTARKHDGSAAGFGRGHPGWIEFVLGPQVAFRMGLDCPRLKWQHDGYVGWAECEVVYTSPILVRREAWESSGGFDAQGFPFSDCDLDWARRLQQLGYGQAVIETNAVVHDNQQCLSSWSASRALHFHRARFRLLKRRYGRAIHAAIPLLAARHAAELVFCAFHYRSENYRENILKRWTLLSRSLLGYP